MRTLRLPHFTASGLASEEVIAANQEFDRCLEVLRRRQSSEETVFGLVTALKLLMIEIPRNYQRIGKDDVCIWSERQENRVRGKNIYGYSSSITGEIVGVERDGEIIHCTDPISTFAHLAAYISREELTVLFDVLTRRARRDKYENEETLQQLLESAQLFRGRKTMRWALKHHRMNTDSSMETRLRLLLEEARFPAPVVNPMFCDPMNGKTWYLDMAYVDLGIIFEYQGEKWHTMKNSLDNDSWKSLQLQHYGCKVIPVTAETLSNPSRRAELIETVRVLRRKQQRLSKRQKNGFVHLFRVL
jgi:hypothetical protein